MVMGPPRSPIIESINLSPAMSHDGKWVAYTSYAKGKPDLYIQNISDNRIAMVDKKGMGISPAWVPGKFELAASLSFSGDPEIYLLTGTGKVINRLTDSPGIDVSPTLSPDGNKMAFVSRRGGTPQIYVQNMNSGQAERLTFQGNNNTQPEWSPKGDKIVYTALAKGSGFNICVIGVRWQRSDAAYQRPGRQRIAVVVAGWQHDSVQLYPRRDIENICYDSLRGRSAQVDEYARSAIRTQMVTGSEKLIYY